MCSFINGKEGIHKESLEKIAVLEKKYSIRFPDELKEYYAKYDGEKIRLTVFAVDGHDCEVAKIVPIISDKSDFEKLVDNDRADGFIPDNFYPIARDRGGNYYYWNSGNGKVYFLPVDDYENPFEVARSVEDFFAKLDER